MKKKLNKTVASFIFKGFSYEIDYLTDADNGSYKEYDIFEGKGKLATCVAHLSCLSTKKGDLIKLAKSELNNIEEDN